MTTQTPRTLSCFSCVVLTALPAAFLLLSADALAAEPCHPGGISFEEVTATAGLAGYRNLFGGPGKPYIIESTGNGAAWLDFDADGWLDLFVVNGSTLELQAAGEPGPGNRLYRNRGDGTFADVTAGSGLEGGYWGSGVAAGDFDNDGLVDLYVTTILEGNRLYRNSGAGKFTEVAASAGVSGGRRAAVSAVFFDYDRDRHLDLFVINYVQFDRAYLDAVSPHCLWKGLRVFCGPTGVPGDSNILYRNNGDGTFTDVTEAAGLRNPALKSLGVVAADFDADGWPDLYVASDSTINGVYRNRGDGTFEDLSLLSGAGFSQDGRSQAGMGVDAGDFDGDGRLDLFVTNYQDDDNTLYHNDGDFFFTDMTFPARLGRVSFDRLGWGTGWRDFDNDGRLDLFVANGHVYPQVDSGPGTEIYAQPNQVLRNLGRGQFADVSETAGVGVTQAKGSRGAAFADFDNDGWMDVLIVNIDDTLTLLRNTTCGESNWLRLRLLNSRSQSDALGARLRFTVGSRVQVREVTTGGSFASAHDPRVLVGLGAAKRVDRLEILWPSGRRQTVENLPANRTVVVHEEKGALAEP